MVSAVLLQFNDVSWRNSLLLKKWAFPSSNNDAKDSDVPQLGSEILQSLWNGNGTPYSGNATNVVWNCCLLLTIK